MKGAFSTKQAYETISNTHITRIGPWRLIWGMKVPQKIRLFLWRCAHGILPTAGFLKDRGFQLNTECTRCKASLEDLTHLFWECPVAQRSWLFFTDWMEIQISVQQTFNLDLMLQQFKLKSRHAGGLVCLASLLWSLWLARNECVFKNVSINQLNLHFIIKHRAYTWSKVAQLIHSNQENIWDCKRSSNTRHGQREKYYNRHSQCQTYYASQMVLGKDCKATIGIGGFILNKYRRVIFIFSGPSTQ